MPVEGFVTFDHAAAVEALRNGERRHLLHGRPALRPGRRTRSAPRSLLSEVYRGSASYVGAHLRAPATAASTTLADLAGKTIAFADPISESGYLYPLEIVAEAGLIDAAAATRRASSAGSTSPAATSRRSRRWRTVWSMPPASASSPTSCSRPSSRAEVRWIAESEPIPAHAVIARPGLDPALKQRFVAAMLELNEPENRWLLQHVYGPDGYVEADPQAYEPVAERGDAAMAFSADRAAPAPLAGAGERDARR